MAWLDLACPGLVHGDQRRLEARLGINTALDGDIVAWKKSARLDTFPCMMDMYFSLLPEGFIKNTSISMKLLGNIDLS